jgi:putative transposase
LQRNLYFLEDYFSVKNSNIPQDKAREITRIICRNQGIKLSELIAQGIQPDQIYKLIADEEIYIDLSSFSLANESEKISVFLDKSSAESLREVSNNNQPNPSSYLKLMKPGKSGVWDGKIWQIVNIGETSISLLSKESEIINLPQKEFKNLIEQGRFQEIRENPLNEEIYSYLMGASENDCKEASRRYEIIAPYLRGEKKYGLEVAPRTFYRWVSDWRKAVAEYGCGYLGLLPQKKKRGNRDKKLPFETQKIMEEFIVNDYETAKQKGKFAAYSNLHKACHEKGIITPSYKTFILNIDKRPSYERTMKRQGKKVAYEHEPVYWELEMTTPKHGDRPFEICHIDHTQLDIELVSSKSNINLGRPWATFFTDAYSRRILAIYLTYDPPSYRSCMMVIRECVRRHGRLPNTIVVDGGKEFQSVYFETLLAAYCCTKKTRPAAKPRFGSVCERIFGTTNTMLIHNLQGNTQITQNIRGITKSVNPRNLAIWTLGSLYQSLCQWADEFYDHKIHPVLGQSPFKAFELGLLTTGLRSHKIIDYDETFRIFTLPTTNKSTAKVIPNKGVKINNIYYWHHSFRNPEIEKTQVSVRYDPYDVGIAYAYIQKHWVTCISEHYSSLAGHSEKEIIVASEELRKKYKNHAQQFIVTASALAEFLKDTEQQELILLQRLRDIEAKGIISMINANNNVESTALEIDEPIMLKPSVLTASSCQEDIKPYEEFW